MRPGSVTRWSLMLSGVLVLCATVIAQDDFTKVNVEREKQLIEGHIREFGDLLAQIKLQECRATLRLIDDRLVLLKKEIARPERQAIELRIEALSKAMKQKEDSLVSNVRSKLEAEGLDAAMDYSQQVLRRYGLPDERFREIDKLLLEEAPKIQQKKEQDAIGRAVKALEAGKSVPDDIDPYLAMTARQMVQAKRDSVRIVREQQRQKESAKQSKEELAAAREREARAQDSLEALRKQRQELEKRELQARSEREAQEAELAQLREKKLTDEEKQKLKDLERKRAEDEKLARDVQRQRDAEEQRLTAQQKKPVESQPQISAAQPDVTDRKSAVDDYQPAESPEPPRTVYRVADESPALDTAALREKEEQERQKRLEQARREEQRVSAIEKLNRGESPFHESNAGSGQTASVRDYMKQRKEEERRAQTVAVQVYELIEKKKPGDALALFRNRRDYLAEYLTREVFVVLERTVGAEASKAATSDADAQNITPRDLPREEQHLMRIKTYLDQRKWGPAVSLFDANRKDLKKYMTSDDFEKLKLRVDAGRKYLPKK